MIIKKLSATFGKLKNETLELGNGLNVVNGSNEAGKSTWCSFMRAMLYGINTSERDKDDHLADKTHFKPWDGTSMEGSMTIFAGGHDITLQRLSKGQNGAMKQFSAVYAGTNEPVKELLGADAGEKLTGVPEKVFERSAFIRQAGVVVGQSAELEKRIAAIVSTGEEEISYSETETTLKRWLNKRRYKSNGLLPQLDAKLDNIDSKLRNMEQTSARYAELKAQIDKFEELRKEFKADLELYERKEKADGRALLAEADKKQKDLNDEVCKLTAALSISGSMPDRSEADKGKELEAAYESAQAVAENACQQAKLKEAEYKNAEERLASSKFSNESVEQVRATVASLAECEKINSRKMLIRRVIAAVFAVAAVVVFFAVAKGMPTKIASAAVFVLACAAIIPGANKNQGLSEYGVKTLAELKSKLNDYEAAGISLEQKKNAVTDALNEAEKAEKEKAKAEFALINQARLYKMNVSSVREASDALEKARENYAALESLIPHRDAALQFYKALAAKDYGDCVESPEHVPKPKYSKAEVVSGLKYAEKELAAAKNAFAITQGEIKSMGDPVLLTTERDSLIEKRHSLSEEYEALTMAIDVLREADAEIQARFAPMLSERASELLSTMTGGKYETLTFNKELAASVEEKDSVIAHSALYLSGGTLDQIYFALRLAICELMLPEDDPCPIVLDDAFANFDDERVARALEILYEIAKKRQVILFTCHKRESEMLRNRKDVNIVSI